MNTVEVLSREELDRYCPDLNLEPRSREAMLLDMNVLTECVKDRCKRQRWCSDCSQCVFHCRCQSGH